MRRISIIIPTYNEADNLGILLEGLTATLTGLDYQIMVVDDASPDGTYGLVQKAAAKGTNIVGIQRTGKLGLASAVLDGFKASDGEVVVMMDSDLSHRPTDLTTILANTTNADIVIGSRYVEGGAIIGWGPVRHLSSRIAIWVSQVFLGISVKDSTSGFALFRRDVLEPLVHKINPSGFKLLLEVLAMSPDARVKEVPITFVNRKKGKSKFSIKEVFIFMRLCLTLRSQRIGVTTR